MVEGLDQSVGVTGELGASAGGLARSVTEHTTASTGLMNQVQEERVAQGQAGRALAAAASTFDESAAALAAVLEQARAAGSAVQGAGSQIDATVGALGREVASVEQAFGPRMDAVTGRLEVIAKEIERTSEDVRLQQRAPPARRCSRPSPR